MKFFSETRAPPSPSTAQLLSLLPDSPVNILFFSFTVSSFSLRFFFQSGVDKVCPALIPPALLWPCTH